MSLNKRFTGDFNLESIDSGDTFSMATAGGVTIDTTTATPVLSVTAITAGIRYRIIFLGTTVFTTVGAVEFTAGTFEIGDEYVITAAGTTVFTDIGAPDNDVGTMFTATGIGAGDGTAIYTLFTASGVGIGSGTAKAAQGVTITGDLTVLGTSTSIKSTDIDIVDNTIVLNSGENGPGVSRGVAGIEIDRGDGGQIGHYPAGIRFSEALGGVNDGGWEINNGDNAWTPIVTGTGFTLVSDIDPHLGGDLVVASLGNDHSIVSDPDYDINITAGTNGSITLTTAGTTANITLAAEDNISIASSTGGVSVTSDIGTASLTGNQTVSLTSTLNNIVLTAGTTISLNATSSVGITATNADVAIAATATAVTLNAGTDITLTAATDITLTATAGLFKVEQEITLIEQTIPILADGIALYNKLSAGVAGEGGTGLYFVNDTVTDELVSKKKAIAYSIIF